MTKSERPTLHENVEKYNTKMHVSLSLAGQRLSHTL